jgi:WD40 repeat protein
LQIWSVATGTLIKSLPTTLNYGVTSVAFSPDGTMIADCGRTLAGGGLELWNVSTGKLITTLDTSANSGLTTVAFSPDGKTLADGGLGYVSNSNFGVLELWDVSTNKLLKSLKTAATNGINSLAFSPDGSLLIAGGYIYSFSTAISNGVLEIWNVSTGQRIASPPLLANTARILSVALSPDGEVLFAGSDSNLQSYSMTNYHLLNYFDVLDDLSNPGPFNSIAVSTDDSLLAYGSASGAVVLGGNPYYNPIPVSSVTVSPQTVMGGTGSTGTVTLKQAAPTGGDSVALVSSNNAVQVPVSVRVEPRATQATFPITTQVLSSNTAVTITATSGGASATATLNISNLSVIGVSLNPTSVVGGNPSTATITLSAPAPTGGITTNVTSSSPWAGVPSTITIIGGATQATVTVTTAVVNAQTTATITAGNGTASTSAMLTITPASLV